MAGYNRSRPYAIAVALVSMLIFVSLVGGVEWMTFKGGNTRMSFTTQSVTLPIRKISWSMNLGGSITTTPIFRSGCVYIGNENGEKANITIEGQKNIIKDLENTVATLKKDTNVLVQ